MTESPRLKRALRRIDELHGKAPEIDHHQERTIETLKLALMYALAYVLAVAILTLALFGCRRADSPLSANPPDELRHPNQIIIEELSACYSLHLGAPVPEVRYFEDARIVWEHNQEKCGSRPAPCAMYVVGAAWPGESWVEYWGPWVRDEDTPLAPPTIGAMKETAAHECCHHSGIWGEMEARACALEIVYTHPVVCENGEPL